MIKLRKKSIIAIIIAIFMLLIAGSVNAATITLDYNTTTKTEKEKNLKIRPGDEVYISINMQDNQDEKIMALYGVLEYDKDVLELVPSKISKEKGDISLNKGWLKGDITVKDGKFLLYSTKVDRDNTAAYIKFRAKDEIDLDTTKIIAKDIVIYNNNYKEFSNKIDDVSLEIKLRKSPRITGAVWVILIIVIILLIIVSAIIVMVKKGKIVVRKVENENNQVPDSKKQIDNLQLEDIKVTKTKSVSKEKKPKTTKKTSSTTKKDTEGKKKTTRKKSESDDSKKENTTKKTSAKKTEPKVNNDKPNTTKKEKSTENKDTKTKKSTSKKEVVKK